MNKFIALLFILAILLWSLGSVPWTHHRRDAVSDTSKGILFFFRIPKTGSEMMTLLLQWLQGENQFRHIRLQNTLYRRLNHSQQIEMWHDVKKALDSSPESFVSFDRHVYFIDLKQIKASERTGVRLHYFSSIRDPVERIVSQFYYSRATPRPGIKIPPELEQPTPSSKFKYESIDECVGQQGDECSFITGRHYDMPIAYFCGHQDYCTELNSERALQQAKDNVEAFFPVVGVLEHLNCTLQLAEHELTPFFDNVQQMYFNELLQPKKNKNARRPQISNTTRSILRRNLTMEYEFYRYVEQRLLRKCQ